MHPTKERAVCHETLARYSLDEHAADAVAVSGNGGHVSARGLQPAHGRRGEAFAPLQLPGELVGAPGGGGQQGGGFQACRAIGW